MVKTHNFAKASNSRPFVHIFIFNCTFYYDSPCLIPLCKARGRVVKLIDYLGLMNGGIVSLKLRLCAAALMIYSLASQQGQKSAKIYSAKYAIIERKINLPVNRY